MPNPDHYRKGQFHGPWSLILFGAFLASTLATVGMIRYGGRFITWLCSWLFS